MEPLLINSIKTPAQHRSFRGTQFLILENILLRSFDGKTVRRQQNSNLLFIETTDLSSVVLMSKMLKRPRKNEIEGVLSAIFFIETTITVLYV